MTENTVNSRWLSNMTDDEIREAAQSERFQYMLRNRIPGSHSTTEESAYSVPDALREGGADWEVEKHPLLVVNSTKGIEDPAAQIQPVTQAVATVRTDQMRTLGIVGPDYGVVQTRESLAALEILAERKDLRITGVQCVDHGVKVRVAALLGASLFRSFDGAPNTIGHYALFTVDHTGRAHNTASVYSVRMECLNGMTSEHTLSAVRLRHTSRVGDRLDAYTHEILTTLLGQAEAETVVFSRMVRERMNRPQFETFATEWLGGELDDEASKAAQTRRQNDLDELCGYFEGGNQGAGATAWGAFNSVTRFIEARRERLGDAQKMAKRFESQLTGDASKKLARARALLVQ